MRALPGKARVAVFVVIAGSLGYLYYKSKNGLPPYGWGFAALACMWIVIWLLTGSLNPLRMVIGEDGRPSTSKLKPFLWTVAFVFAYAVLYTARARKGYIGAITEIPPNLLIAIGFDAATLVAAKGITQSQLASGEIEKPSLADPAVAATASTTPARNSGPAAVFEDDKGFPDIAKIQTVTWTVFAIVIYLVAMNFTLNQINNLPLGAPLPEGLGLPDIAPALMVLIGLGNAAYLGKKLVTTDTPALTGVSLQRTATLAEVTVAGVALGTTQDGSRITINNKEIAEVPLEWSNERVRFKLPAKHPDGGDWVVNQVVRVGLFVRGQTTNQLPLTIGPVT